MLCYVNVTANHLKHFKVLWSCDSAVFSNCEHSLQVLNCSEIDFLRSEEVKKILFSLGPFWGNLVRILLHKNSASSNDLNTG